MFFVLAAGAAEPGRAAAIFEVPTFGAKGDGTTMDTGPIQSAIDAASKAGGGVVWLPAGKYLSGSLHLKSHVEFHLDRGAVLLGSASRADYQRDRWYALLLADRQEDIKLSGDGVIDGQGLRLARDAMRRAALGEFGEETPELRQSQNLSLQLPDAEFSQKTIRDRANESERPMLIEFNDCHAIQVSGVTLRNSSGWVETYARCDGLTIEGIKVDSTAYWNNDGMDITDCRNVQISKCEVNTADDGICLKSGGGGKFGQGDGFSQTNKGCYNVNISDCRIRSSASALKLGTASYGDFRKIHVSNLTVYDTCRAAIALETVDGGTIDDVLVENVTATNTGAAIFLRLGRRNLKAPAGQLQNVTIRNVKVWVPSGKPDAGYNTVVPYDPAANILPSSIAGLPGHPVRNVRLENLEIFHPGGADPKRASVTGDMLDAVPEKAADYPEFSMFGELPAWGIYVRHAEGIQFTNVHFGRQSADYRPAMVLDDVQQVKLAGLTVGPESKEPDWVLQNVRRADFNETGNSNLTREKVRFIKDCVDVSGLK